MTENSVYVEIAVKTLSVKLKFDEIIRSTEGFRVHSPGNERQPDILIYELGKDTAYGFQLIESKLNSGAVDEVFITAQSVSPELLLQAMRTGAKEFFSQPLKEAEVRQALEKFKKRRGNSREPVKSGQIVGVIGSKGGVGTTTVAVNLATNLAENRNDQCVALVDMNMLFGEIPLFLEINPTYHWGEITKNIDRLDSTYLMNILTKHASGTYVLPSPAYLNGNQPNSPEIVGRLLSLMRTMFDFVIIDGGQSLDDLSLYLKTIEMSDTVLVITILSLPCLSNTSKILKSLANLGYLQKDRIGIVINRYLKKSEISLKDAEASLERKILWTIPNDYKTTISAINQGKSLSQIASKAPTTRSLKELADYLLQGEEERRRNRWKFLNR